MSINRTVVTLCAIHVFFKKPVYKKIQAQKGQIVRNISDSNHKNFKKLQAQPNG